MHSNSPAVLKDVRYLSSETRSPCGRNSFPTPGMYGPALFTWIKPAGVGVAFLLSISPIERKAS